MFYHLLVAVVVIVALIGGWMAVQALARRQSPDPCDEPDVLACKTCAPERAGHCSMRIFDTKPAEFSENGSPVQTTAASTRSTSDV